MTERKDSASPEIKAETTAAPAVEAPKIEALKPESPKLELPAIEPATEDDAGTSRLFGRTALAASVAVAALLGGLAGAAATGAFSRPAADPVPAAVTTVADETRALRETAATLSKNVAALQARLETSQRNAAAQIGKLSERFERAEKANAEPAAKLAKIAESLDRLERRAAAAPEVTGSVTAVAKSPEKPGEVQGWRLREFFGGRAVVENRGGALYEVGPGSSLPGLGRVETIRRQDGKIVVVTAKGHITGTPEPRRAPPPPPRYLHYRY